MTDEVFGSYVLDSRPASEFYYEGAKNKLVNLDLDAQHESGMTFTTPGDDFVGPHDQADSSGVGRQGRLMRLAGWIDLESRLSVSLKHWLDFFKLINSRSAVPAPCSTTLGDGKISIIYQMMKLH